MNLAQAVWCATAVLNYLIEKPCFQMFCALPSSLFLWIIGEVIGSSIFGQVFNHLSTEIICSNTITGLPCIVIILNSAIACNTKPPPPLPSPIHTWIWHRVSRSPEICRCCYVQNIILLQCLHIHKESFTILGPGLSASLCPAYNGFQDRSTIFQLSG